MGSQSYHICYTHTSPHQIKPFDKMEGPTAQPPLPKQKLAQHYSSVSTYYPDGHICCTLTGSYQGDGMNAMTLVGCTHSAEVCWHSCHQLPACIPSDSHSFLNDSCIKKTHGWNCTLETFQMKALLKTRIYYMWSWELKFEHLKGKC
jgi:hypothetical protein